MPIGYTVAPEKGLVFIRAWDVLTEADISALVDAMRTDSSISPEWSTVNDMREVTGFAIGGAFMRGFRSAFSDSARRAVLVASRETQELVQMWLLGKHLAHVGVFDAWPDACEWLGQPPATEPPDHPATTFGATLHA